MGLFRRKAQQQRKPPKNKESQKGLENGDFQEAQEEIEMVELRRREQEAAFRKEDEERKKELESLNTQIDNALSDNSEEFIKNIRQPGGQ